MKIQQYVSATIIELSDGSRFLEPNTALETPTTFTEYVAHDDENLFMVSNRFYGATRFWYDIAVWSGIVDPFDIATGTTLLLPHYDDTHPEDIFI